MKIAFKKKNWVFFFKKEKPKISSEMRDWNSKLNSLFKRSETIIKWMKKKKKRNFVFFHLRNSPKKEIKIFELN